MANEAVPFFFPGDALPAVAGSGGVTGKTFVAPTGPLSAGLGTAGGYPTVVTCGASAKPVGVAGFDAIATAQVSVYTEGVIPVTAGANLSAGQEVMSDASGHAIVWDTTLAHAKAGLCLGDTTSGNDAPIVLFT